MATPAREKRGLFSGWRDGLAVCFAGFGGFCSICMLYHTTYYNIQNKSYAVTYLCFIQQYLFISCLYPEIRQKSPRFALTRLIQGLAAAGAPKNNPASVFFSRGGVGVIYAWYIYFVNRLRHGRQQ
ncbi:hypothetical protein AU772_07150 [Salmonella enterica subsp. enterica serovar Muenchen]|nr:hypothetical protein [Salmonella enterica subsp. enterica serovar Muenchen]